MQTLRVNGYDMPYLEVGQAKDGGHPLVCVHGTLGDFRTWYAVLGPLSRKHRVIAVSLRHFFPEHWDGVGDDYRMAQHVADVIAFLEQIDPRPVDLMGHSRGGHIAFRVAQQRPDLLRKVVLAEPGGDFDATLDPAIEPGAPSALATRALASVNKVRDRRHRGRAAEFRRRHRRRRRLAAAAGRGQAAASRQHHYPARPGARSAQALQQGRRGGDQDADAPARRRRHHRLALDDVARDGQAHRWREDGRNPRRAPLDVRARPGRILPGRDGVPAD